MRVWPKCLATDRLPPLSKQGEGLFESERCTFCHGDSGSPDRINPGAAPIIGGQNKEYLAKTLKDMRDGNRKGDKFGIMEKVLSRQSDENIEAIVEFSSTLEAVDAQ